MPYSTCRYEPCVVNDYFDAFIENVNYFVLQLVDPAHFSIYMMFLTGTYADVHRVFTAITNLLIELQSECDETNAKLHMDSSESKNENDDTSDSNRNKIYDEKNNVNGNSTNSNTNSKNNNSSNDNNSISTNGSNQINNNININNSSIVTNVSAILAGMMRQAPHDFSGALKQIEALRKSNRITEAGATVDSLSVLFKD